MFEVLRSKFGVSYLLQCLLEAAIAISEKVIFETVIVAMIATLRM